MRKNEVKRTIEQVVRTEYIAEDGQIFYTEEECKKYEESALFAVSSKLKRLANKGTNQYELNDGYRDEEELEIFDIQTNEDLDNLRRYLYLTLSKNGVGDKTIQECMTSVDGKRKDYVFDSVTVGHEVLIFWSYDADWFWVHKDGSLNGYFEWIKERYNKIISKEEI